MAVVNYVRCRSMKARRLPFQELGVMIDNNRNESLALPQQPYPIGSDHHCRDRFSLCLKCVRSTLASKSEPCCHCLGFSRKHAPKT